MKKHFTEIFYTSFLLVGFCFARGDGKIDTSKSPISLASFKLYSQNVKDTFVIDVSLPRSYSKDTEKNYSVIYLTDGYWRREQHKSIHYLSENENVRELIVVGIGYPSTYNFNEIRVRDLVKHADKFLGFIVDELIPKIEMQYRTNGERTLWGSSFGGYFALYTLLNYPGKTNGVFTNYIIASPPPYEKTYLGDESFTLFDLEKILFTQTNDLPINLYLTVGGNEKVDRFLNPFKELVQLFDQRAYKGLKLISFIDPGKDHFTVWEPTLYQGIRLLLKSND